MKVLYLYYEIACNKKISKVEAKRPTQVGKEYCVHVAHVTSTIHGRAESLAD